MASIQTASTALLDRVDNTRSELSPLLEENHRSKFGQYMTPAPIARFMAGMFSAKLSQEVRLLDAGAGVGSLTAAFLERCTQNKNHTRAVSAHLWEIDEQLRAHIRPHLNGFTPKPLATLTISGTDFIDDASRNLYRGVGARFTHAILNPPYKKLGSNTKHRAMLRACGLETVNLYSGFVGMALALMEDDGELVAIIPRSFCNGPYFRPFREFIFEKAAITRLHLFESRRSAFSDDNVLQENIIIKMVRGADQGEVEVSTSTDASLADLKIVTLPFERIVSSLDPEKFICIPTSDASSELEQTTFADQTLFATGLEVSTGPVVDFRLRDYLRDQPGSDTAPLLYANHFTGGALQWPKAGRKANALMLHADTLKWLMPTGNYTVVKRFSSKEEKRRIVAYVVDAKTLPNGLLGFENHLNVFHRRKKGLSIDEAHGIAVFLNSTAVDQHFRRFSGHTQVNATDLRTLRYPSIEKIRELGRWAKVQRTLTQDILDKKLRAHA